MIFKFRFPQFHHKYCEWCMYLWVLILCYCDVLTVWFVWFNFVATKHIFLNETFVGNFIQSVGPSELLSGLFSAVCWLSEKISFWFHLVTSLFGSFYPTKLRPESLVDWLFFFCEDAGQQRTSYCCQSGWSCPGAIPSEQLRYQCQGSIWRDCIGQSGRKWIFRSSPAAPDFKRGCQHSQRKYTQNDIFPSDICISLRSMLYPTFHTSWHVLSSL